MSKERILVVDDEANARTALAELLREEGYAVETAADGFKAFAKFEETQPDLILTDLKMPGMDGIELLHKVRQAEPNFEVVVMTAFGAVESAIQAMRAGATDYLTKPLNLEELLIVLERALERRKLRSDAGEMRQRLAERYSFENIIGASPPMQELFKIIAQVASSRASILLSGESGTGKELVAAAIHQRSPRAARPFVRVHCAALAETLLESELFGHERGSFTGADRRREGRFERASGGTLFLDEVGEIPQSTQVKLLRVLQEREFERVGGDQTIQTDVRVIAATNRDLKRQVELGNFREDLFYRLNVINLNLPPLRERPSDIPALAGHFLSKYASENGRGKMTLSDSALERLSHYPWPGNVRELENALERAVVLAEGATIETAHLPAEVKATQSSHGIRIPGSTLADIERYAILETLSAEGGSTSKAASKLGISPRKIQYKLHQYGEAPRSGKPVVED